MEAGAAQGPAAGDAAGEAPGADSGEQQGQGPDLGQLVQEATAPLQEQLGQVYDFLQQQNQPAAEPGEPEPEFDVGTADLSYLNPESPNYNAEQAAQQFLGMMEQQQQAGMAPLQQQLQQTQSALADMRAEQEARQLAEEFPDLNDPAVSDKVFETAQQWVGIAGLPPEAAQNMHVIRAVYMMGRAAELANAEDSQQQPGAANLEGAGGAAPASPVGGLTAEQIVGDGGRSKVLPFG